jgi:hypothetical protein
MLAAFNALSTSSVFTMTKRRLFNGDSKSPLEPLCLSPDDLQERLQTKAGLQEMILQNNRDHLISGKAYNTAGFTLQLIEQLGRECTVAEVIAESEGELTERSVIASIGKINGILYSLAGLRLTLVKETGQIRLVNESDALTATQRFAAKFTKVRDEFVRTMDAYEATGGNVVGVLSSSESGRKLAALSRVLAPYAAANAADTAA